MKIQPPEAGCDPCCRRNPGLRGLLWLGLWLWIVIFLAGPAAASQSTPLPPLERTDISKAWRVCAVPTQSTLEQVLAGDCLRVSEPATRTALGFDPRAFWMQVVLVNTSAQPSQRLLTVGHARLQEVSLFEVRGDQIVSRHESGISVPLADKPLAMARPAFELRFEPGEQKSLWLRVASQTTIDLKTELWSPREAYLVEQRLQFFETLALGLMLLCMLYSFGSFLLQREKLMLYFSGFMAAEFIVELCRTGLMQLYLWPVHWAFDARILGTAVALSLVSFTLLLRAFLHPIQRFPLTYRLYLLMVCLSLAGIGWSWLVDYRQGTQWWTATIPLTSTSVAALALLAGHRGQSSAKLLLQSFAVMLLIESVRIFSVLGWIETIDIGVLVTPWAIALATSFILINMNQRSVEVQAALAKSQLESAARLQFMSQMSHELRSPLTTMLGHLQLMKHEPLAPPVRGGIQAIWRDARQLLAMIDDILDYAKGSLGHKGLHPLPRRWGQLVRHIGQSASALAQTHGHPLVLTVTGASDAALMVDERRLQQVLNNLLTNAARYAQQGEIQLTCALEPSRDTDPGWAWRLNFSVSDRGEGIALQDQERIFEPFQRGPKAHLSSHKGIGMGLAIARQLVQNMGGAMHLNSQPGQGSCFSFHVLCAAALPEDFENLEQDPAMAPGLDDEWQSVNTVAPAQTPEPPEVLARPDDASLAVPRQLVANGQLSDLLDWATALEKASPGLTAYCQRVRQAAMELDMPMLQSLCAVSAPCPSSVPPPPRPATAP
jgi:signal transduction histidine kinase